MELKQILEEALKDSCTCPESAFNTSYKEFMNKTVDKEILLRTMDEIKRAADILAEKKVSRLEYLCVWTDCM